jgi:hypothetical protein
LLGGLFLCQYLFFCSGYVGITIDSEWKEPNDPNNPDDVAAAEREMQFTTGIIAHPIYSSTGDWPPVIKQLVYEKSIAQGYTSSRLPDFTQDEIDSLKGMKYLIIY